MNHGQAARGTFTFNPPLTRFPEAGATSYVTRTSSSEDVEFVVIILWFRAKLYQDARNKTIPKQEHRVTWRH